MRVGIDAHFIGNQQTGNETYTVNLVRSLAAVDTGPNEYTLYFTNSKAAASPPVDDPRYRSRLLRPGHPLFRVPIVLPRELFRRPVDVLHTHYTLPPGVPKSTRTVVTVHDISWEFHPELYNTRRLLRLKTTVPWSARKADRILAVSHAVKDALVQLYGIDANKIVVTHLAASQKFHPQDEAPCRQRIRERYGVDGRFILFVGNMTPRKNLIRVLRAFAWLRRERRIEERLVVAGPGIRNSNLFQSALDRLQLRDGIVCTGHLYEDDLPDLYNAAEVFLFPSVYEAFGLPTLEAMACGTPVIASKRPAFPEIAGDAALLVDPQNWESIAAGIEQVLSNASLSHGLRAAGLKRAAEFDWKTTAAETLAVYKELAQAP